MSKSFVMPILFLLASAGIVMFYGVPYYEQLRNHQAELSNYNEAFETVAQVNEVEAELEKAYRSFTDRELERLQTMLPNERGMLQDVAEINNVARENGVRVTSVSVIEEEGSGVQAQNDELRSLGVTYSLTGEYSNFRSLLRTLESRLRVTDVQSISFSAGDSSDTEEENVGTSVYDFEVETQTYWLNQ